METIIINAKNAETVEIQTVKVVKAFRVRYDETVNKEDAVHAKLSVNFAGADFMKLLETTMKPNIIQWQKELRGLTKDHSNLIDYTANVNGIFEKKYVDLWTSEGRDKPKQTPEKVADDIIKSNPTKDDLEKIIADLQAQALMTE